MRSVKRTPSNVLLENILTDKQLTNALLP